VAEIQKIKENHYVVDGKLLIEDVNDLLGINLADPGIDTIGGWYLTQNSDAPIGSKVEKEGYVFKAIASKGYHILNVEVKKI
jgi:CBS domain containing-hemolysin-like protein